MDYGTLLAKLMRMSDEKWKRHANPWSVWTRFVILPFLAITIWSRILIGWWCLFPVILLLVWTMVNPGYFGVPVSTRSWASRATLGERVWLNKKSIAIPDHHSVFVHILNSVVAVGFIPLIYGLVSFEFFAMLLGLGMVIMGKLWFLDRMVWLYQDMAQSNEEYCSWLY
ncbi:MAG: DUF6653 family protein [Granulosicoccus sp.]